MLARLLALCCLLPYAHDALAAWNGTVRLELEPHIDAGGRLRVRVVLGRYPRRSPKAGRRTSRPAA